MHITSPQETKTVTYRYIDIVFPSRIVQYILKAEDVMARDEHTIRITFGNGKTSEVFITHALAIEQETIIKEEPVDRPANRIDWFGEGRSKTVQ
jgi:hypothetical protein